MQKFFSILIFFLLFSFLVTAVAPTALAQDYGLNKTAEVGLGEDLKQKSDNASIPLIIGRIINIVLSFAGIAFLILMIYGGFTWMTSGGNDEKHHKAIQILQAAAYGLLIVIAAFLITRYIGTALINSLR